MAGLVVLDAQASRVLNINPGSLGVVQLIGLNITRGHQGYVQSVRGCRRDLLIPHRPHGRLTCCPLFAGRRCLCPGWHSDLVIVHYHWQHSFSCACSRSKSPIAPMGKLLTCLPRLSLAHRSTPGGTCRRDLESSHRPDGRLTLCSLFAGRRCRSLWRHSGHHIVHHQWEYSWICVHAHVQNFPSPRWEHC